MHHCNSKLLLYKCIGIIHVISTTLSYNNVNGSYPNPVSARLTVALTEVYHGFLQSLQEIAMKVQVHNDHIVLCSYILTA